MTIYAEKKIRRELSALGYCLHKSSREVDKGLFSIIDIQTNLVVVGVDSLGNNEFTIEDVRDWLNP